MEEALKAAGSKVEKIYHLPKDVFLKRFYFVLILCFGFSSFAVTEPDAKENKATLLGIDSDKNGIRDDVQLWIAKKYKDSPKLLQAFNSYAFYIQKAMSNKDNKVESNKASHSQLKSLGCIMYLFEDNKLSFQKQREDTTQVEALFRNTKERITASDKVNSNFHGQSVDVISKEEACSPNNAHSKN